MIAVSSTWRMSERERMKLADSVNASKANEEKGGKRERDKNYINRWKKLQQHILL